MEWNSPGTCRMSALWSLLLVESSEERKDAADGPPGCHPTTGTIVFTTDEFETDGCRRPRQFRSRTLRTALQGHPRSAERRVRERQRDLPGNFGARHDQL